MVCCGIVGRGACIQSLLFSVLLVLVFPFLSSREFSGLTSQAGRCLQIQSPNLFYLRICQQSKQKLKKNLYSDEWKLN